MKPWRYCIYPYAGKKKSYGNENNEWIETLSAFHALAAIWSEYIFILFFLGGGGLTTFPENSLCEESKSMGDLPNIGGDTPPLMFAVRLWKHGKYLLSIYYEQIST